MVFSILCALFTANKQNLYIKKRLTIDLRRSFSGLQLFIQNFVVKLAIKLHKCIFSESTVPLVVVH